MYHYTDCGLPDIALVNGYKYLDTPYGEGVSIADIDGLHMAIGLSLVESGSTLTGAEFRFLRKELDLSQKRLAEWIDTTELTVGRWERGENGVDPAADKLLRALYLESVRDESKISDMLEMIADLDAREGERQFERTETGWFAAA